MSTDLKHTACDRDSIMRLHIVEIMQNFNFALVHQIMTALDWHWGDGRGAKGVPTVEQLRDRVEYLIVECYRNKYPKISLDGFTVRYSEDDHSGSNIQVSFEITDWHSYYDPKDKS